MVTKGADGRWYKPCTNCGKEQSYLRKNYAEESARLQKFCKACSNKLTDNCSRGLYEEVRLSWVGKFQYNAELRGFDWELSPEIIWEMYVRQDKRCALSGVKIGWAEVGALHTASLDRIDSSLGYTIDNTQLVHKDINMMKHAFDQDYFIELCRKVAGNA
jgi:hypothetical protein